MVGLSGFLLKLMIRGLQRKNKHQPVQAVAMNPVILNHIHSTLNMNDPHDITFWGFLFGVFLPFVKEVKRGGGYFDR